MLIGKKIGLARLVNTLKINNMDKKSFFIIVLAIALILSFIFRPSKTIDMYEDEINELKIENNKLLANNKTLSNTNSLLDSEIKQLLTSIDSLQIKLANSEYEINKLKNGKGKISNYVNTLNADGVARKITEYLNKRK